MKPKTKPVKAYAVVNGIGEFLEIFLRKATAQWWANFERDEKVVCVEIKIIE